jgi:hypothetical protein
LGKPGASSTPSVLIERVSATLAVAVYGDDSPIQDEWEVYLATMRTLQPGYRMVIFSSGGGPTTMQRRDLEQITEGQDSARVAVITRSLLARGIVTAIRWFNREIKAFDPSHRQEAFVFLKLNKGEVEEVLRFAMAMAKELGIAEQLHLSG